VQPHEYKPRKMLPTADAAAYCGSSASTFAKYRLFGGGPIFCRLGRRVVYDPSDLDAWIAENRYTRGKLAAASWKTPNAARVRSERR
jgi:hypothetical protein